MKLSLLRIPLFPSLLVVFIAYLIAAIPAVLNCLIAAQVGSILPVSAADYVFTSVVLRPFLGFLKVWVGMIGLIVGVPILAYGFAAYMGFFFPDWDRVTIAASILITLLLINLLGIQTSVRTQMVMVTIFVTSLLIFGIGGLFYADWELLTPMVPNGTDSVLNAAVPAFYSYSGFLTIVVIAEEIKNPSKNIPLTLLITFIFVATIYTLVTLVLPALIPWQKLGTIVAPMSQASQVFLPDWFATIITLSALLAAATSINVSILTASRSFFALARNRIYPKILCSISKRTGEPDAALVLSVALALAGVAIQGEIIEYASMTVVGILLYGVVWAVALTQLPKALPVHYDNADFKLNATTIWTVAVLKIAISVGFLYVGIRSNPVPSMIYLGLLSLGAMYYFLRSSYLQRNGISLQAILRQEANQVLN